jgi:dTDP-4-dehydrorhamnose reductase
MRILITGGSGLLGQYLNIELSKEHSILTLFHKNIRNCGNYNSAQTDIRNKDKLSEAFYAFKPDIVLHTAAISAPLYSSQIDSALVYDINVNATKYLAGLCAQMNTRLIYTSTDLVYAGYRGQMLKEDAKLNPLSLYAETKLMGEIKIKEVFDNYLILRTSLLYGIGIDKSYNHFHQMYLNLKEGVPVKLFTDQFRTPLELSEAAAIINDLIKKDISTEIINFGGRERVSRYQLGEILAEIAGFDQNLLQPVKMNLLPEIVKVKDVSLNTDKLRSYGIKQNSIEDSIKSFLKNQSLFL